MKLLNIAAGHLETYKLRQKSEFERSRILHWHCTFGSLNNGMGENSLNSPLPKYRIYLDLDVLHGQRSTSSGELLAWPVSYEGNAVDKIQFWTRLYNRVVTWCCSRMNYGMANGIISHEPWRAVFKCESSVMENAKKVED